MVAGHSARTISLFVSRLRSEFSQIAKVFRINTLFEVIGLSLGYRVTDRFDSEFEGKNNSRVIDSKSHSVQIECPFYQGQWLNLLR